MKILNWLSKNKTWLFSGIGVFLITMIFTNPDTKKVINVWLNNTNIQETNIDNSTNVNNHFYGNKNKVSELYPDILKDYFPDATIQKIRRDFGIPDSEFLNTTDGGNIVNWYDSDEKCIEYNFENGSIYFFFDAGDDEKNTISNTVFLELKSNTLFINIPHVFTSHLYDNSDKKEVVLGKTKFKDLIKFECLESEITADHGTLIGGYTNLSMVIPDKLIGYEFTFTTRKLLYRPDWEKEGYMATYERFIEEIPNIVLMKIR